MVLTVWRRVQLRTVEWDSNTSKTGWANGPEKAGWGRQSAVLSSSFCRKTRKELPTSDGQRSTSKVGRQGMRSTGAWHSPSPPRRQRSHRRGQLGAEFVHFVLPETVEGTFNIEHSTLNIEGGKVWIRSVGHCRALRRRDGSAPRGGGVVQFVLPKSGFQSLNYQPSAINSSVHFVLPENGTRATERTSLCPKSVSQPSAIHHHPENGVFAGCDFPVVAFVFCP